MADYNKVQIEDVYLTDDGLVTGMACRVRVEGLNALLLANRRSTAFAVDGTPHNFLVENTGAGAQISIYPFVITESVLDDIRGAINAAENASQNINIVITDGPFGDFDLECMAIGPEPIEASGEFNNDRIEDVVLRFAVVSINTP